MLSKIKQLCGQKDLRTYFANASWLVGEKVLRLVFGLLVGVWVARYLGPEKFGVLSYVLAFTALFTPLSKLGLDGIVSRDIARNESDIDELLSSSIAIKLVGSLLVLLFVSGYMLVFREERIYFYLGAILSSIFLFKSFEVLEFYYRARLKSRFISIANGAGMAISSLVKVGLIVGKAGLVWFAVANLVDVLIATFLLVYLFIKEPCSLAISKTKLKRGRDLLKESWPMVIAGVFALIYMNIDQVMIDGILGSYFTGQYSAAVRISALWYFIPMTIGWSVQTAVVNAKKKSELLYYRRLQMMFTLMALMAYVLILPISFFSEDIIGILYGQKYILSGDVLGIHIFASLFVFVGVVRGLWVTNESYFKFALFANICAGILNIILNYVWLPIYGIVGAAWATLISYFFIYVGSGVFFKPCRKIFIMQVKSLFLFDLYKQLCDLRGSD